MRDLVIFGIIFGLLPFVFKRPALGALLFTWISLMNPHRLAYGAAYNFQFAAVVAGITILSMLMSKEPKRFPLTPVTVMLLLFYAWMNLTSQFALEPGLVWREWDRVTKTFLMVAITLMVINTEKNLKLFVWVVALSLGIYGLKGGLFTIASGGHYRVFGPDGSYIAENNSMALALVVALPMIWYLRSQVKSKLVSMLVFLWLKSPKKAQTGLAVIVIGVLIACIMPEAWYARMDTINDYQEDSSALGRINAWYFAINIANTHLLGGGFNVFTPRLFMQYAPDPLGYHVAHSIYFQVLGDHGYVGLIMFLVLMFFSWRTGTRIIKFCGKNPELKWASDLAKMAQVSIIGYAVSGAFLSLAYFDLYYDIIIILVLLEKQLILKKPLSIGERMQAAQVPGDQHVPAKLTKELPCPASHPRSV